MFKIICTPFHTGKSEYIYSQIEKRLSEGKEVILMVPEQEAVIAETRLCEILDGKNSLRLEVLNFKRLCNRVFREYGGLCYNYINKGGQAVILWRVLSSLSVTLKKIKISKTLDEGLIKEISALIKTFKAYGITPDILDNASKKLDGSLKDKLDDITAIYTQYQSIISEKYNDASDDLDRLYDTLCSNDFFSGKCVFFDSFYDFTAKELSIIEKIAESASECTFTVEYSSQADAVNYLRPSFMKKSLEKLCKNITGQMPQTVYEYKKDLIKPEIEYAVNYIWDYSKDKFTKKQNSIRVYSEADKYDEAKRCAALCAELVRKGARYRDIAIIARNMSEYEGIIDTYLNSENIPCHISKRNKLFVHPAVRVLLSALSIISHGYRGEDIISYMKTGYTGLNKEKVALLSSYIRLWNIRGKRRFDSVWNMNPKEHSSTRDENCDAVLTEVNKLRETITNPIFNLADEIADAKSGKDTAGAIYNFLCEIKLDEKLNYSNNYIIWDTLVEILEQYADCAPNETDAENVYRLLKLIINTTDIGTIPRLVDEVAAGNADMIRLHGIKHIIILGANDTVFPKAIKDDGFFFESEVEKLDCAGVKLPDNIEMRIDDEKFFFARALSFACESINIFYSGKQSDAVSRICELFEDAENISNGIANKIFTMKDAMLEFALSDNFTNKKALSNIVLNNSPIIEENFLGDISEENTKQLYRGDFNLTKSIIDSVYKCPLKYRLGYNLSLKKMTESNLGANEGGTFMHAVFEKALKSIFKNGKMTVTEEEFINAFRSEAESYIEKGIGGAENIPPRVYSELNELTHTAEKIASSMFREFSNSDFVPTLFECSIGTREKDEVLPYSVSYDDERKAYIYGVCDRVDVLKNGDDAYLRVIDYKSGKEEFNPKVLENGNSLQLPLYLLSFYKTDNGLLKENLKIKGNILPGGFMYYRIADANIDADVSDVSYIVDSEDASYIDKFISRSGVSILNDVLSSEIKKSLPEKSGINEISADELNSYEEKVKIGIKEICNRLISGDSSISDNMKNSYCSSCEYRTICRRGGFK